ncbi:KRAB-A domain-containing protein 2-like protein [Aphelenchoides avenae]|nr:KRAB-A domain-containing protein 2-like protein [Aphelenchus avenae]
MYKDLVGYGGITKDAISKFLSLCKECELKRAKVKKSIVVKLILSADFNSRCQVDLIDLQSRPDGDFKHLLVYQDHLTKFVVLRALKQKTMHDVVAVLMEVFSLLGAPKLLHSDNGKVFANRLVTELVRKWPQCRIVHGKPRHSQSQGSVERANRDVGDMLTMYLRDNKTLHWAAALPIIQAAKNRRYHRGIFLSSDALQLNNSCLK